MLVERQQNMRKSLLSMILSTMGITDDTIPNEFEDLFGPDIIDDQSLIDKTNEEKLDILDKRRIVLSSIIEKLHNVVDEIDLRIESLKKSKL